MYAATEETLVGAQPIYRYGIVMEVSVVDPDAIVVHARTNERGRHLVILNDTLDEIEVLSEGISCGQI